MQYSVAVRNAQLDALETAIGTAPILEIRTGAAPANCAAADSGSLLVSITLPSDWLDDANAGIKSKLGTWSNTITGTGEAAHFRIKDSGGTVCHVQGDIALSSADMVLDDVDLVTDDIFTVDDFDITAGNA